MLLYECGNYAHHAPLYGNHDAKICALGNLTQLCWMEGKLKQARKADEQTPSRDDAAANALLQRRQRGDDRSAPGAGAASEPIR